jgi:hypothetical protein
MNMSDVTAEMEERRRERRRYEKQAEEEGRRAEKHALDEKSILLLRV